MTSPIRHAGEPKSNAVRAELAQAEPVSQRTFTPTQVVIAQSAGVFHWTPEGRRLYDFTSGVLVANLGHNPRSWLRRFFTHMGYTRPSVAEPDADLQLLAAQSGGAEYFRALPMTSYNALTPVEQITNRKLLELMSGRPGGKRMEQVLWAASGSEAIQKALWASMAFAKKRDMVLATRFGFHGKKGLACAITGSENDKERDPRVRFVSFPMAEVNDLSRRDEPFDFAPYRAELDALWNQFGEGIGTLCTEPYLGGGGSYHPPKAYLQGLQAFCREHGILFILDEVQANFGRTGDWFAYESYGLEPDLVVLGKGMGNGVPVAAVVGRRDVLSSLDFGEASDTWSANPLQAAATLATIEEFQSQDVLGNCRRASAALETGLCSLKEFPFIAAVRGEKGGMVWGIDFCDHEGAAAAQWANRFILECYLGDGSQQVDGPADSARPDGLHLLGPLAKKVVRISPPLTITLDQVDRALLIMRAACARMITKSQSMTPQPAGART